MVRACEIDGGGWPSHKPLKPGPTMSARRGDTTQPRPQHPYAWVAITTSYDRRRDLDELWCILASAGSRSRPTMSGRYAPPLHSILFPAGPLETESIATPPTSSRGRLQDRHLRSFDSNCTAIRVAEPMCSRLRFVFLCYRSGPVHVHSAASLQVADRLRW